MRTYSYNTHLCLARTSGWHALNLSSTLHIWDVPLAVILICARITEDHSYHMWILELCSAGNVSVRRMREALANREMYFIAFLYLYATNVILYLR